MKKKIFLGAVLAATLVLSGCNLRDALSSKDVGAVKAKEITLKFIKDAALVAPGTDVSIKEIVKENGAYRVVVVVKVSGKEQDITSYLSTDGKKFFPEVMDIAEVTKQAQAAANPPAADNGAATQPAQKDTVKTDKPVVDLFVMSFCPYGTQMEKGIIPAVQALGSKITFNLKFVSYTMHGDKEANENLRQYCIEKDTPAKFLGYLQCFLKTSAGDVADAEKCMATSGITKSAVDACISSATDKFGIKAGSTDFPIYADENTKYGVQGSPTLVINGITTTSGRDSASILKAICGSFKTPPAECQKQLSATAPSAGFGEGTASGANSSASCGT